MSTININNTEFYYELHGEGQSLVLISGYSASSSAWLANLDALSKHFQVLIFDNRGAGQTKDDGGELTVELMADDTVALADALGLEQPHYVGWSMGGSIAQTIAAKYPEKLTKLGILVSSAKWRHATLLALAATLNLRAQDVEQEAISDVIIPYIFGEAFLSSADNIALVKKMDAENPYPQSLENQRRQHHALTNFDGREQLKMIKAKTVVMYALQDLLSLPHEAKYLANNIDNAELIEFDCGHMPPVEVQHEFETILTNFLTE